MDAPVSGWEGPLGQEEGLILTGARALVAGGDFSGAGVPGSVIFKDIMELGLKSKDTHALEWGNPFV